MSDPAQAEPYVVICSGERSLHQLAEVPEIEHTLMRQYLRAAFILKRKDAVGQKLTAPHAQLGAAGPFIGSPEAQVGPHIIDLNGSRQPARGRQGRGGS